MWYNILVFGYSISQISPSRAINNGSFSCDEIHFNMIYLYQSDVNTTLKNTLQSTPCEIVSTSKVKPCWIEIVSMPICFLNSPFAFEDFHCEVIGLEATTDIVRQN